MKCHTFAAILTASALVGLIVLRQCWHHPVIGQTSKQSEKWVVAKTATKQPTAATTVDLLANRDSKYKRLIGCQHSRRRSLAKACKERYKPTELVNHRESLLYELADMMILSKHRMLLKIMPDVKTKPWKSMVFDNVFLSTLKTNPKRYERRDYEMNPTLNRDYSLEVALKYMEIFRSVLVVMHPLRKLELLYEKKIYPDRKGSNKGMQQRLKMMKMQNRRLRMGMKKQQIRESIKFQRSAKKKISFLEFISKVLFYNRQPGRDALWGSYDIISSCAVPYGYIAKDESLDVDLEFINSQLLGNVTSTTTRQILRKHKTAMELQHFSGISNASKATLVKNLFEMYADDMAMFGYSYVIAEDSGTVYATCSTELGDLCY